MIGGQKLNQIKVKPGGSVTHVAQKLELHFINKARDLIFRRNTSHGIERKWFDF